MVMQEHVAQVSRRVKTEALVEMKDKRSHEVQIVCRLLHKLCPYSPYLINKLIFRFQMWHQVRVYTVVVEVSQQYRKL